MSITRIKAKKKNAEVEAHDDDDEGSEEQGTPQELLRLASESSNLHFYNHPCLFRIKHDDDKNYINMRRRFGLSEVGFEEETKTGLYRADHGKLSKLLQPHAAILSGDFVESSITEFCVSLEQICNKASVRGQQTIPIYIDSFGGDVYSLLKVLDTMEAMRKVYNVKFATIAQGKAMSAGAFMLMFGDIGYRYATPRTTIMVHDISSGIVGRMSELKSGFNEAERLSDAVMNSLSHYITGGKSKTHLEELTAKTKHTDLYLSANEAKQSLIIDHIGLPEFVFELNVVEKIIPLDQSDSIGRFFENKE